MGDKPVRPFSEGMVKRAWADTFNPGSIGELAGQIAVSALILIGLRQLPASAGAFAKALKELAKDNFYFVLLWAGALLICRFFYNLVLAPYRQRNEARQEVGRLLDEHRVNRIVLSTRPCKVERGLIWIVDTNQKPPQRTFDKTKLSHVSFVVDFTIWTNAVRFTCDVTLEFKHRSLDDVITTYVIDIDPEDRMNDGYLQGWNGYAGGQYNIPAQDQRHYVASARLIPDKVRFGMDYGWMDRIDQTSMRLVVKDLANPKQVARIAFPGEGEL